jgi:hypothetical protein
MLPCQSVLTAQNLRIASHFMKLQMMVTWCRTSDIIKYIASSLIFATILVIRFFSIEIFFPIKLSFFYQFISNGQASLMFYLERHEGIINTKTLSDKDAL